ncbi:MAG: glycerol kinase GlpK [Clostridiales bacterium]|nr:glycerol kinase GlpK [Clostridiales bacterium]
MKKYILALDQGTTSSRAILFNHDGNIVNTAQKELTQIYPKAGWVEHDPMEIWATQSGIMREVIELSGINAEEIASIGITNQRETTIVWNKTTGKPIYNAIVWQCRRTANICSEIINDGFEPYIKDSTGLVVDAYFSATKIKWILDNVADARILAEKGELLFGTIDTWLIWNLTRKKFHVTDYSNASRTMLFDIENLKWDDKILKYLDIPKTMLPTVRSSSEIYGYTSPNILGIEIPISGIAGDQQAALFGQGCFFEGMAKNTYGTGCFILMNTGDKIVTSKNGLLTTIAWGLNGRVEYALEGSVFMGGATIQWLRDELNLIADSEDSEYFASKVDDTNGVYLVPAFAGLGAPHWDMYARGILIGLTRGVNKNHIIRAALESIAYQSKEVIHAMEEDSGIKLATLKVDGGATQNNLLMQFQSDLLQARIERPKVTETTALGAAYLAGLAVGFWKSKDEILEKWETDKSYLPELNPKTVDAMFSTWLRAVERSKGWENIV